MRMPRSARRTTTRFAMKFDIAHVSLGGEHRRLETAQASQEGSSRRARPDPAHPPLRIDASNSPAPDFCAGSRDNRGRNASESA